MENKTVFLTGATGFLGSYLLKEMIQKNNKIYVLARASKEKTATERIFSGLRFWDRKLPGKYAGNVFVVEGDIVRKNFGVNNKILLKKLLSETEIVIHSAALPDLRTKLDVIRKINVGGTKNVLDFGKQCVKLKKMCHISTAYVVGKKNGIDFDETMLDVGQTFNNTYEQSKYEAEKLCGRYARKGMNISIFRPSMIIGDSKTGKTKEFHLFYEPLYLFSKGIFKMFPGNPNTVLNLICVDSVCKAIVRLSERKEQGVFNLMSPKDIKIKDLLILASKYYKFELPKMLTEKCFNYSSWSPVQKKLAEPFIPYFNLEQKTLSNRTQRIMKKHGIMSKVVDRSILSVMFRYCEERGYIKRNVNN